MGESLGGNKMGEIKPLRRVFMILSSLAGLAGFFNRIWGRRSSYRGRKVLQVLRVNRDFPKKSKKQCSKFQATLKSFSFSIRSQPYHKSFPMENKADLKPLPLLITNERRTD